MPRLTRWLIRTALLYLVAALALGVALAAPAAQAPLPWLRGAWPGYVHLFAVGWVTQLIVGVAFWLFPRIGRGPPRERLGWAGYVLMNAGLLLRVAAEPLAGQNTWSAWAIPLAALAQAAAAVCWATLLWPRAVTRRG